MQDTSSSSVPTQSTSAQPTTTCPPLGFPIPPILPRSPSTPSSVTRSHRAPSVSSATMLRSSRLASSSRQPLAALPTSSQDPTIVVTPGHCEAVEDSASGSSGQPTAGPRDRRAFSFPAEPASPHNIRQQRQSQATLPPFIRKPNAVSKSSVNSPNQSASNPKPAKSSNTSTPNPTGLQPPTLKRGQTNSTGGNTPLFPESVFSSTSESDEERDNSESPFKVSPFPMPITLSNQPTSLPLSPAAGKAPKLHTRKSFKREATLTPASFNAEQRAQDTLRLPQRDGPSIPGRRTTHSPVVNLVASSASSRSREDIISWAKAVGARPNDASSSDEDHVGGAAGAAGRGRSRTRRSPRSRTTGKKFSLPEEAEEEEHDASRAGTTPKSSIGSALAGLSIGGFGVGPIVKALSTITTSATASTTRPAPPIVKRLSVARASGSQSVLGLQAVPSPAEVNRVAVVTSASVAASSQPPPSTSSTTNPTDSDAPPHFGGATPTLSTISISELVDPSVADHPDHVEVVTDVTDDGMSSASYARRPPSTASRPGIKAQPSHTSSKATSAAQGKKATTPTKKAPLPLRPLVGTASAIWNLSTYLRSITPFSISSAIAPLGPFSPKEEVHPAPQHPSPTKKSHQPLKSIPTTSLKASVEPVPTSRVASPDHTEMPAVQLVRSLPMDIALPLKPAAMAAVEERMREREAREWLNRSHSRRRPRSGEGQGSRARSRSAPRSRCRSRSRSRSVSRSRQRSRSPSALPSRDKSAPRIEDHSKSEDPLDDIDMDMSDDDRPRGRSRGRRVSYDADESAAEDAPRRGRSRKGKALGGEAEMGTAIPA